MHTRCFPAGLAVYLVIGLMRNRAVIEVCDKLDLAFPDSNGELPPLASSSVTKTKLKPGHDLKQIYQASTEKEALLALKRVSNRWDDQYPGIRKSWLDSWHNLNTLFNYYPMDIRKSIYTTNAIESLNSVIRKALNKWKVFPIDYSARKLVYLAIQDASKKWTGQKHS